MKKINAFTLAEVLITLGIIGIIAALTFPGIIEKQREKENVAKLEKFISTLSQAINQYKADTECIANLSDCLPQGADSSCANFDRIAAKMIIADKVKRADRAKKGWIPNKAYNYYGEEISGNYGGISKDVIGDCAYLLNDGTTFSMDVNPQSFNIVVDVNGPKLPNRVGRDVFFVYAGNSWGNRPSQNMNYTADIMTYPGEDLSGYNSYRGMCMRNQKCNPDNIDPTKDNGASITSYVLLHKKLPPVYR